ncbi:hypothetical protein JOE63_002591 [Cellulosimicrobium cellulans]|uniref:hypothetical protein n=1 Tax=Cellulosimicrobium cellulans TaxID=1710 RepID=UPI00195F12AC|nr:hypothetical protein [Cellulosimicrobium cellulans]MBM7820114.1 hypothetical protein [Cellulosimicrobium cellulans]
MDGHEKQQVIADGLSSLAIASLELGESPEAVRAKLLEQWHRLGAPAGAFAAAAVAVGSLPLPPQESAYETEQRRHVRELLGLTSAEDQIAAALAARELLQDLAREVG